MSTPLVSVVIPTHNRPELLTRALESVYAQTFTDFEVIVVDDGDAPRVHDVLGEYLARPNFVYLETNKNQGGSATRNVGITHAQGKHVAFLDDDDEWLPKKLEVQVQTLRDTPEEVGFVFCAINNIHNDTIETTPVNPDTRDYSTIALIRFNGFITSGLVVKRSVFDEVGMFDESLPSHQEAELMLRVTQKYQGVGLKEAYVNMRFSSSDDHIGGNVHRRIMGREMVMKKHEALLSHHPELLAKHYFWLALQYRESRQYKEYVRSCFLSLRCQVHTRVLFHFMKGAFLVLVQVLRGYINR